jgi:cation efflux system membrane fusion protein
MIPATALVETDGKKIAFVQADKFYEPVEIVTGAAKGDQIEVTQGLSAGEQLVTQGGLSLYSEALKAKGKPEVAAAPTVSPAAVANNPATTPTTAEHDKAHAEGKAHGHDEGFSVKKLALVAGGAIVVLGGGAALALRKKAG